MSEVPGSKVRPLPKGSPRPNVIGSQNGGAQANNGPSAALKGATLAFAARARRLSGEFDDASRDADNNRGARKAAVIAGGSGHGRADHSPVRMSPQNDEDPSGSVMDRIKQFSSEDTGPRSSPVSQRWTDPQHVAAQLAVDRSKALGTRNPSTKQSAEVRGQNPTKLYPNQDSDSESHTSPKMHQATIGAEKNLSTSRHSSTPMAKPFSPNSQQEEPTEQGQSSPLSAGPEINSLLPSRRSPSTLKNTGGASLAEGPIKPPSVHIGNGVASRQTRNPSPLHHSQSNTHLDTTGISNESLADAKTASSLASSRAPSPSKQTPPPPLPQRRQTTRSFLRPPKESGTDTSRSPSPSKSLRRTMREGTKSDDDDERMNTQGNHRHRERIKRPHSNKHKEANRRWTHQRVTDLERKRYEGVWAANKGLLLNSDTEAQDMVVNVVVRAIWSRSRLSPVLLGQIWDLVARDSDIMMLSREEFVVGLWLIDQSLRGRKLPWRVPQTVWESVQQGRSQYQVNNPTRDHVKLPAEEEEIRKASSESRLFELCSTKSKECFYLPSNRGGPRKKRPTGLSLSASGNTLDEVIFQQVDTLAVPGAGLRHLDVPAEEDSSSVFDSISSSVYVGDESRSLSAPSIPVRTPRDPSRVRLYGSEQDILNAYYIYIHQYFPIFPPPRSPLTVDQPSDFPCNERDITEPSIPYLPQSPVTLAISTVLALVPHPGDPNPSEDQAVRLRRSYAHKFARLTLEAVDADSEVVESASEPCLALEKERAVPKRFPIHAQTPVEPEAILALLLLSIYEYTQRGNLVKMRMRAGQAYAMAMDLSLHALPSEADAYSEAKRRAWWMTFYCVCQGSIVSRTTIQIAFNDPRFVTPYPNFAVDSEGWSVLIEAQRALLAATQFIIDLNHTLRAKGSMTHIFDQMKVLDVWVRDLIIKAEASPSISTHAGDDLTSEAITAQSMRSISRIIVYSARIKIHRFRAFSDIPIFFKKHCDLSTCASIQCTENENPGIENGNHSAGFECCAHFHQALPDPSTQNVPFPSVTDLPFPFTSLESTSICLQSALVVAQMFDSLPYPNPSCGIEGPNGSGPVDPSFMLSRTMPSFACCSMQSSYAMLMLYYRSRAVNESSEGEGMSLELNNEDLADELYWGLNCVLGALNNYSIAFEALKGMRDELTGALSVAFPLI